MEFMIESIVKMLFDWQDLVGALIGGLVGIVGAFIVANSSKKYEQRAAGMLILIDLISLQASIEKINELAEDNNISDEKKPNFTANKVAFMFPKFSPLFEASLLRIITVDLQLAAHLTLLNSLYRDLQPFIGRVTRDAELIDAGKSIERPKDSIDGDINVVYMGLNRLVKQAEAAQYYIDRIILGKFPLLFQIRRFFKKNEYELKYIELLKTGEG